ncbi:MAG: hypothetical protein DMF84_18890 [Acidobacteria bacterium]|nr:MAG: hypothetical protein DMF84_18890 [Acidobacteriota bacterium]
MSPILVRPVREQLEHDRVIRLLLTRLKRKHEIAINIGDEQAAGVKVGIGQMFPDLVLTSTDRGKRLEGIVEVETGESVNHLEAMAQWAHFGRMRVPFHLYVPAAAVDIAKRLCAENQVNVAEIWSYHTIGDQTRFTLVQRDTTQSAPRETTRHDDHNGQHKAPSGDVRRKGTTPRTAPPSRTTASSSARSAGRKAAPAARGAKPRASRAKPAARKTARTQKRK